MLCPFPGMDPFIESQKWKVFHGRFIAHLGEALVAKLRPRHVVDTEDYVCISTPEGEETSTAPDLFVVDAQPVVGAAAPLGIVGDQVPLLLTLPAPATSRQRCVVIRSRNSDDVITTVELLSPWNKSSPAGRSTYASKRESVIQSETHLVEIDLLRGGQRLPMRERLPPADYYAFVCRTELRPRAEVYRWNLKDALPTLPIPLAVGDADVPLDLQAVFTETYDKAGYDYALDYTRAVEPALTETDAAWVRERLAVRGVAKP